MKDQILKMAKVKSEKEFYKKYPTEEAFMKAHGKAFKKAAMGSKMVNDQLHQLTDFGNPPIAQDGANTPKFGFNKFGATAENPQGGFGAGAGQAGMSALQNLDKIASGISAIGEQKKAIKKADQNAQLAGLALQAQQPAAGVKTQQKYVRPEDSLVQPGQLGNPYGTGTNYLQAQDGAMIGGNPTEIQNTYAPTGDLYQDLGYQPLTNVKSKQYKKGGRMPKAEFGEYFQDSGQAQVGSAVGESIGSAFGPAGAAVGKLAGKVLGNALGGAKDARALQAQKDKAALAQSQMGFEQARSQGPLSANLEDGGKVGDEYKWVSHTWQPQVIAKFGDYSVKDLLKPPHDADMLRSGGHLAQVHYTPPSAKALFTGRPDLQPLTMNTGGRLPSTNMMFDTDRYPRAQDGVQMAMGGELEVGDGGHLETISYNPNLPGGEIGMFRGASHDNGGIKTKYGENEVEVEGGEPAVKLKDGGTEDNLVVFGNIKINKNIADLMGDPKAKGKKFKHYIADVAKSDKKQLGRLNKGLELIDNADGNSAYDQLKLNTGQAILDGATAWQKINADKIKEAALVQDAIHQTANELGVKSDKLAEGKLEKEMDPSMMGKFGKTMSKAQNGSVVDYLKKVGQKSDFASRKALAKEMGIKNYSGTESQNMNLLKQLSGKTSDAYVPPTAVNLTDNRQDNYAFNNPQPLSNVSDAVAPAYNSFPQSANVTGVDIFGNYTGPQESFTDKPGGNSKKGINWNKIGSIGAAALTNLEPWLRPSNANEGLPPDQLYPEYFAMATNQLEPVQAQTYQPMLDNPYDISLNDQINAVDSQARAAIRAAGSNPAAQAYIMSQAAEAKNRVLGEQNRINQANKMQVYDKNRAALNDAQLRNLQILDQQYVRQAQAKSNTKAQTQAALSSIAAKTAQQRATNRKLAVMENLYNFRFDPSGRAYNVNGPAQFNMSGNPFNRSTMGQGLLEEGYEDLYNTSGRRVGTRRLPKSERDNPSLDDLDNYLQKNGGKTSKNKARNSSIVKALKNL